MGKKERNTKGEYEEEGGKERTRKEKKVVKCEREKERSGQREKD